MGGQLCEGIQPTNFNNTIGVLRTILQIGVERGIRYSNPAAGLKRARLRKREFKLPSQNQFHALAQEIRRVPYGPGLASADLVEFLAYGGFRKNEAAHVTWADCDFDKGEIVVRGNPETGTKNSEIRRVPMIPDMRQLLDRLRQQRRHMKPEDAVMRVKECQGAINRACRNLTIPHFTHSLQSCTRDQREKLISIASREYDIPCAAGMGLSCLNRSGLDSGRFDHSVETDRIQGESVAIVILGAITSWDDTVQRLPNPWTTRVRSVLDEISFVRERSPTDAGAEAGVIDVQLELRRSPCPAAHLNAQTRWVIGAGRVIDDERESIYARVDCTGGDCERSPIGKSAASEAHARSVDQDIHEAVV